MPQAPTTAPTRLSFSPAAAQWLGIGIALLGLGAMIAFNLQLEHERTSARAQERLRYEAKVIALNVEHRLTSIKLTLQDIREESRHWEGQAGTRAGNRQLNVLANAMAGIRTLNVLDADGHVQFSNRPELLGSDLSYRDYFQTIRRHPDPALLYVSRPFRTLLGVHAINLSMTRTGSNGEFAGVVSATLDPEYFKTLMSSVISSADMWDAMAHGDGHLFLMVPEREKLHGMNLAQPGSFFTRHRDSGQPTSVMIGKVYSTGETRMLAQHTIHPAGLDMDKPLVVAVSRDMGAVFQTWRRDASIQAALYGLLALLSVSGLLLHQRRQHKLQHEAADARAIANRFSVALDHIPAYIYLKDRQHRYVYANKATLELFNCSEEELRGSDDTRFFPPETVVQLHAIDTRVMEQGQDTAEEVVSQDGHGNPRVYWEVKTPIYEDGNQQRIWGLCGISTDITERRMLRDKLEAQAHQDDLTGLSNRRHFLELGETELARVQRYNGTLSLFMLDVDHFKHINDTYGHKAGDIALQKLGQVLRETLRTVDIIGRMGGEEFAVLLPETDLTQATEVAERLRENIAASSIVLEAGLPLHFTVSIGVTAKGQQTANLDMLLSRADDALYQAKRSGRNKVCVTTT